MSEINVNELNNIAGGAGNDIPATYTVVPGDNLSKIAAKFKTTWKKLYELNKDMIDRDAKAHGVKSNFQDYIYPGQVLKLR
jgi:LysM repeat protein